MHCRFALFFPSYDWCDRLHDEEEWTRLRGPAQVYLLQNSNFYLQIFPLGWFTWQGHPGVLPDLEILLVLRSNLAAPNFADICDEGHQFLL